MKEITSRNHIFHVQSSKRLQLLYLLYLAEVFDVIADCVLVSHSYADVTQTYISIAATNTLVTMQRLAVCIEHIEQWMGTKQTQAEQATRS